jgi:hypothetical protein
LTEPGAEIEKYPEPVWVFEGETLLNGSSIQHVTEYIPALKAVPENLTTQFLPE